MGAQEHQNLYQKLSSRALYEVAEVEELYAYLTHLHGRYNDSKPVTPEVGNVKREKLCPYFYP